MIIRNRLRGLLSTPNSFPPASLHAVVSIALVPSEDLYLVPPSADANLDALHIGIVFDDVPTGVASFLCDAQLVIPPHRLRNALHLVTRHLWLQVDSLHVTTVTERYCACADTEHLSVLPVVETE